MIHRLFCIYWYARWFRKVLCSFKNRVHRIHFWCNPSASPSARAKRLRKITYSSSVKTIALSCPAKVHMLWIINVTQMSRVIAYRVVKRDVWKFLDWCLKIALVEFASEFANQHRILILLLLFIFSPTTMHFYQQNSQNLFTYFITLHGIYVPQNVYCTQSGRDGRNYTPLAGRAIKSGFSTPSKIRLAEA